MPNPRARYERLPYPKPSFSQFVFARFWEQVQETPWDVDRLFGGGLIGFGLIFHLWPEETVSHGFRYLAPIIQPFSILVTLLGLCQTVVGILEWTPVRKVFAAFGCLIYAGFAAHHQTHAAQLMFYLGAVAEGLIVLKRY